MAQTEEFMFQNVAYRPTVYRTGAGTCTIVLLWGEFLPRVAIGSINATSNERRKRYIRAFEKVQEWKCLQSWE